MSKLPVPFSNPTTYAGHSGIDYPQRRGAVIRASGPFTVESLGYNSRGGFYIWVRYDGGPLVGYHHMDSHDGCPRKGSRGVEGTQLGYVGNTGNSTGPHLHSEVSGHATTDGYWRFFDPDRVVGAGHAAGGSASPTPSPNPIESEEDEMTATFINIQGKAGSHRGGCYAIMRDNVGKLFARFVSPSPFPGVPTVPAEEYKAWRDTMPIA